MKFLLFFILGFAVFYLIRQRLLNRPQQPDKPVMRTVTEADREKQSIEYHEKNKH